MDGNTKLTAEIRASDKRIGQLEFDLAVEREVNRRLRSLAPAPPVHGPSRSPERQSDGALVMPGSVADEAARALREHGQSMRARDITRVLVKRGVKTNSKRGLLPMVVSTLRRRQDLFVRVERGIYKIRNGSEGGDGDVPTEDTT